MASASASGDQFALRGAVGWLREGTSVAVSGAGPRNLVGVIVPGSKVPTVTNNGVLYHDDIAIASLIGGNVQWIEQLEPGAVGAAENVLIKRQIGSPLLAYLR